MSSFFRYSPADRPPLRIGLLLDSQVLPAFAARIVADIKECNFANVEFLVYRKPSNHTGKQNRKLTILARLTDPKLREKALYAAYLKLDRKMKPVNHPLDPVDCCTLLSGIEQIEVDPEGKKFVHRFPSDAIATIRAKNLDVILRFGFNILHGDILQSARYGVWSYHHGDNEFYRGGPPHFWELVEHNPLSGVMLQVLTEKLDAGLVLCKSQFNTQATLSASANRFAAYWGASGQVIQKLNQLHQFGWEHLERNAVPPASYKGKHKIYRSPTNAQVARWLGPVLLKKAARHYFKRNRVDYWRIGIRRGHAPLYDTGSTGHFEWIASPKGHFWADPFLFEHEGRLWVFYEDYSYPQQNGLISVAEVTSQGSFSSPVVCLSDPERHYSYPHVFRSGSEIFMIPESYDSQSVDLYRCLEFPNKWTKEKTLFQGKYVDTTVWQSDGLWWLMTTLAEPDPRAGQLLLFYAESLTGSLHFHPSNPISTDVRTNRGAGRIIATTGGLIRPSQSCSPTYGYSLSFHKITELSTSCYSESRLRTIEPWDKLAGVHTYARAGDVELIDAKIFVPLKKLLP
jgi:hypothetical protein